MKETFRRPKTYFTEYFFLTTGFLLKALCIYNLGFMTTKIMGLLFAMALLILGILLILIPWINLKVGAWEDNYLLTLAVKATGMPILRTIIVSAWVRGGITGFGVFNIILAFWEIVRLLQNNEPLDNKNAEIR